MCISVLWLGDSIIAENSLVTDKDQILLLYYWEWTESDSHTRLVC
jgi:hypothetical protein